MSQKKICVVGAYATGKTSLVARFVKSIYSDIYHTSVGVNIDKKLIKVKEQNLKLILWDLHGEDKFQKIRMSYLRGASGYILVVDGTRRYTLDQALSLQQRVEEIIGIPFIIVLNKSDLIDEWEIKDAAIEELAQRGWTVIKASAKTGLGVEESFLTLAEKIMYG
jgi:small GTP-binding protein